MNREERVELLEEASELLQEAIDKIDEAVDGTGEEDRAKAYILPSLKMSLGSGHGYLGSQPANIEELIKGIEKENCPECDLPEAECECDADGNYKGTGKIRLEIGIEVKILEGKYTGKTGVVKNIYCPRNSEKKEVDVEVDGTVRYLNFSDVEALRKEEK